MDPFIGQIILFGGNFAPRGFALCQGQLLQISSNSALFSILGTTYGGDGRTTFGLPDLRGRAVVQQGTGAGLSPRNLGQRGGEERVSLTPDQLPPHPHGIQCSSKRGNSNLPEGGFPAVLDDSSKIWRSDADKAMAATMVTGGGSSQPHDNMMPFLALNYCIALVGVFPSRN